MSFFARLLRRIRSPTGLVGRDLQGNRFYEYPSVSDDPRRTKRVVKYAKGVDMLEYVSGQKRLAVQWTSWMTHTRSDPPTIEELQADLERRRRILHNAAVIEAQERLRMAQIAASDPSPTHSQLDAPANLAKASIHGTHNVPISERAVHDDTSTTTKTQLLQRRYPANEQSAPSPSPWKPPPRDEPHSWNPRASVRRGS